MKIEGNIKMGINFQHLLEYDRELAIALCNKQERFAQKTNPQLLELYFHIVMVVN